MEYGVCFGIFICNSLTIFFWVAALKPTCGLGGGYSQSQVVSCFNRAVPLLNFFSGLVCVGVGLKMNLDSFLGSQLSPDSVGISPLLLSLSTLLLQRRIGP